jgi:hypothetical protein
MNVSYACALFGNRKSQEIDLSEAKEQFSKDYLGISFEEESGDFIYRGVRFDFFKAGMSIDGGKDGYILVDKLSTRLWLFNYGDKEARWKEFLNERCAKIESDLKFAKYKKNLDKRVEKRKKRKSIFSFFNAA